MRIVDCHAHFGLYGQVRVGCPDSGSMLRAMDACGVERALVSSFLGIGPDSRAGNDLVIEAVRSHPDRFTGYITVNPNRPAELVPELERCFAVPGMGAIKLHPALHRYPADGPAYTQVFEFAARHRLPVLSHDWGSPAALARIAAGFAEANFIIAHTGFWDGRSGFAYAQAIAGCANVFVDLVYSNIYHDALERMVALVGAQKILWGSDFPLHDLGYQIGRVLFSKLDAGAAEKILGGNLLRLLDAAAA
jgi:uncharacterized protein